MMKMSENDALIIESIILNNFKSYKHASVSMKPLTIVSGDRNGSGKTSISEAICYALTGKLYVLSPKEAVHHGEKKMSVTLIGTYNGNKIEIYRAQNSRGKVKVLLGDETYEGDSAQHILNNIIKYDEFTHLVNIDGHNIEALIRGTPAKRSEILDEMFGIEAIGKIIKKLNPRAIKSEINDLEYELKEKEELIKNLERSLSESYDEEELRRELSEKEEAVKSLKGKVDRLSKMMQEYKDKESEIKKKRKERQSIETQIYLIDEKIKIIEKDCDNKKKEIEEVKKRMEEVAHPLSVDDAIKDYPNQIYAIENRLKTLSSKMRVESMVNAIRAAMKSGDLGDTCPICNSKISPKEIDFNKGDSIAKSYDKLREALDTLKTNYSRLIQDAKNLNMAKIALAENLKTLDKLKRKKLELERKMDAIPIDEEGVDNYDDIRVKYAEEYSKYTSTIQEISVIKMKMDRAKEIKGISSTIDALNKEIESIRKKILEKTKVLEKEEVLRNGFMKVQEIVRSRTVDEINPNIGAIISLLHKGEEKITPKIRYKINIGKSKYGIRYEDAVVRNDVPCNFDALSTGERAICALSLIISINQTSYHKLSLLIFDEIHTSGIDDDAVNQLLRAIVKFSKKINVIFIDRRKSIIEKLKKHADKEGVEYIWYKASSEEGVSTISEG